MDETTDITAFDTFWNTVLHVWDHGFMGIDIGRIIVAILILGGFLLFRGLFSTYILGRLHRITDKTKSKTDDKIVDALIPPIKFIPVLLGLFFAAQYSHLDETLGSTWDNAMRNLIVFTIFWAFQRTLEPMSHMMKGLERALTPTMVMWVFKVMKVLVIFIAAAIILEIWGIKVAPLLAGLGLFGAAIALGAQDVFKNLIAGITIIAEKKFEPNDWIKVDGVVEGTVDSIGLRSTQVRQFDKAPVQVPNSLLADAAITNFSRMTHRRIFWKIGVTYSTSVDQLKLIRDEIAAYIENNEAFAPADEIATFVRIDSFNASSIDIMIYCFTKTIIWGEFLEIKEQFALALKEIIEDKAGASFAFPSQSLYVEQWPGEAPEIFVPPTKKNAK